MKLIFTLTFLIVITGFGNVTVNSSRIRHEKVLVPNKIDPAFIDQEPSWIDSIMQSLTLEEKIAQLFMVAAYSNRNEEHVKEVARLIEKYNIGGLIFFQGGPLRQAVQTNYYQSLAKTPLLVAMDAEWGLAMRLDSTIKYPKQMTLGAIQDNQLVYNMGADVAHQLKRLGVHVNFAPVVDVNNNPKNPVINSRSFGEDKLNVARKGLAYMMGLQDNYVLAVAKHFPGHGDTDTDSHLDLPVINHDSLRLDSLEMYPFKQLIRAGLGSVMMAHLSIPALDATPNLASTLSQPIVTGMLKEKMGFKGLIFTDALNMKGVSKYYKSGEVEVKALQAGNDVLLMPDDVPRALEAIKRAISKGELSETDIEQRCRKIIAAKQWVGLDHQSMVDTNNLLDDLNNDRYMLTYRKLIESSVTLIKNDDQCLPLKGLDTLRIASVAIGVRTENEFQKGLNRYTHVTTIQLPENASDEYFKGILEELKKYNLVLVSIHNTDMRPQRNFGVPELSINRIEKIIESNNTVLTIMGSPYLIGKFKNPEKARAVLIAYEESNLIEDITSQVIFGAVPARGLLPVTANNKFSYGHGFETFGRSRLKYSVPEEVNMNSKTLGKIDSIANDAIGAMATPGCQVLVAKDGVVVYHKAFGHHTYLKKKAVDLDDLYDLASVTKITATVPLLMRMQEQGMISLFDPIGKYMPELDTTNKKDLIIGDILTHQARLEPWLPFYLYTMDNLLPGDLYSSALSPDYPFMVTRSLFMTKHLQFKPDLFKHMFSWDYPLAVADGLYLNKSYYDSIFLQVYRSE